MLDPMLADAHGLTVLHSPAAQLIGWVAQLPGRRFELGRQPTQPGLAIEDPLLSRVHASLTRYPGAESYVLCDHGSANGSFVGGERVEQRELVAGDIVRVGDTILRFGPVRVEVVGWSAPPEGLLHGCSLALRRVLDEAERAAMSPLPILVSGETGAGKELLAQHLHRRSNVPGRIVGLRCEAMPGVDIAELLLGQQSSAGPVDRTQPPAGSGLLAAAWEGTLLLDRVDELDASQQRQLLSVLQVWWREGEQASSAIEGRPRLVSASIADLRQRARDGSFRPDLFARLEGWPLCMPPLRERPEDLRPIVEAELRTHAQGRAYDISADFMEGLALYDWPFNTRELVSLVRRAVARLPEGGCLRRTHLPAGLRGERSESSPSRPA